MSLAISQDAQAAHNVTIHVGRYEKRPVFMVPDISYLGQYHSAGIQNVIDTVSKAYAGVLSTPYTFEV